MQLASVRDFKMGATKYLGSADEVVITKRGRPIAILTPVPQGSTAGLLLELRSVLSRSKISKKEILKTLEQVREEVFG